MTRTCLLCFALDESNEESLDDIRIVSHLTELIISVKLLFFDFVKDLLEWVFIQVDLEFELCHYLSCWKLLLGVIVRRVTCVTDWTSRSRCHWLLLIGSSIAIATRDAISSISLTTSGVSWLTTRHSIVTTFNMIMVFKLLAVSLVYFGDAFAMDKKKFLEDSVNCFDF